MPSSRRHFLQLWGAASAAAPSLLSAPPAWESFSSLPRAQSFGLLQSGAAADPASLYSRNTAGGAPLSFDIANHQILGCLSAEGSLDRVAVNQGILPVPASAVSGGVYTSKMLSRSGPWRFSLRSFGSSAPALPPASFRGIRLIENFIPEHTFSQGTLSIQQVSFAPIDPLHPLQSPRAIFFAFHVENHSQAPAPCPLCLCPEPADSLEIVPLGPTHFTLLPGSKTVFEIALLLETDPQRREILRQKLLSQSCYSWFQSTLRYLVHRQGKLSVADAPFFADVPARYAELCRQSLLFLPDGQFGGGFMGSDVDHRDSNWAKDTYYAVLGASYAQPEICRDAIFHYLDWGLPAKPIARGLARFPNAPAITQSLSLAVAPITLAAHYYRLTGDHEFFRNNPALIARFGQRLKEVLATRQAEPFLFPSMFISNGEARGHFHTGSNVAAWFAFQGAARLAKEVYLLPDLARQWQDVAARIQGSLLETCRKTGALGLQFVEGVFEDGTFVPGHDGEETDTTLMPFYGFCPPDTPELLRHAELALSPLNPYYAKSVDGIWWHNHGSFRPATAPAWATALAGASNLADLQKRLLRFQELTDVDGSLWWWPYRYGETQRHAVQRGNGATKCAWAAAAFLARFLETVLGCRADVPSRTFHCAPFFPWNSFRWQGLHLGAARFDFTYERTARSVQLEIKNANPHPYRAHIRISNFENANLQKIHDSQGRQLTTTASQYFGKPALDLTLDIQPGQLARLIAT